MAPSDLNDRERQVLEAVIRSYVETAEPAGSRTISRRFGLGVSPATIRNTMSDLEEKGYLYHPHTSAGRVPTDRAYRLYVDTLLSRPARPAAPDARLLAEHISVGRDSAIEAILRRAAQTLGILTQELGVALGPRLDQASLQRLELVRLSSERLLMVLSLDGGAVRTVFVEVRGEIAEAALASVSVVLNERLAGLTLREIRSSLGQRLRDSAAPPDAHELLNIFLQEGEQLFDVGVPREEETVLLSETAHLADQPEFASSEGMRRLVQLSDARAHLGELLRRRSARPGISITIGDEHDDPRLESFTMVTAEYRAGPVAGVIGVIGPTRMPYDKIISLVSHTSQIVTDLLD